MAISLFFVRAAIGVALFASPPSFAEDVATPAPPPKPSVIAEAGSPYRVTWPDGREARLRVRSVDGPLTKSHFKVIDNDCSDWQNMSCTYNFKLRRFFMALVWTKNPLATDRIGAVVEYGNAGQDNTSSWNKAELNFQFTSGLASQNKAKMAEGLPKHSIECADFRWMPTATKEAPAEIFISRWDGEDNSTNPETGNNENRTTGGAMGVHLKAVSSHEMKIDRVDALTEPTETSDILNLSPNESLTFRGNKGRICQVGLSSNLTAEITSTYQNLENLAPKPADAADFIVGSSEVLDDPEIAGQISFWFYDGYTYK